MAFPAAVVVYRTRSGRRVRKAPRPGRSRRWRRAGMLVPASRASPAKAAPGGSDIPTASGTAPRAGASGDLRTEGNAGSWGLGGTSYLQGEFSPLRLHRGKQIEARRGLYETRIKAGKAGMWRVSRVPWSSCGHQLGAGRLK